MTAAKRLLRLLLPVTRPHTGRHQARAIAAPAPEPRPDTQLLEARRTWYLPAPPRPVNGPLKGARP